MSRIIEIQALVDFADGRKWVDPWELTEAAEAFYKSVKVVGIAGTKVVYKENGLRKEINGNETSVYVRAFAAHITRLVYRWDDLNSGRLEEHFDINIPISVLLGTGVFKTAGRDLACTNVAEIINAWTANK